MATKLSLDVTKQIPESVRNVFSSLTEHQRFELNSVLAFLYASGSLKLLQAANLPFPVGETDIFLNSCEEDPPDVELRFGGRQLRIEVTAFPPQLPLAIKALGGGGGPLPGLSDLSARNLPSMVDAQTKMESLVMPHFTDVSREAQALHASLHGQITRKELSGDQFDLLLCVGWSASRLGKEFDPEISAIEGVMSLFNPKKLRLVAFMSHGGDLIAFVRENSRFAPVAAQPAVR